MKSDFLVITISRQWIERVSWSESSVFINLSRETIKDSPEYTEESLLTRDYEIGLPRHYDLTAMDRARKLERVERLHQPLPRDHQGLAGIHGGIVANPGL